MSRAERVQITSDDELIYNLNNYCCLFDIEICGLKPKLFTDHPLSKYKCYDLREVQEDNGRIVRAAHLYTTVTELDFFTLQDFYTWDYITIGKFYRFMRGYLPTSFIKAILKLYEDKTTLKGVKGKETEYTVSKGMLNACYGMAVTDIVRPEYTYADDWGIKEADTEKQIEKYNKDRRRFLYYPWGVWVTAYARRNLFDGIKAFGSDYIYSDTDSIKALNGEKHSDYIENYNRHAVELLQAACKHHGIPEEAIKPKTIKGIEKPLGVWDFEGVYDTAKFLGAKRYLVQKNGQLELTVAGVGKKSGAAWLSDTYGSGAFEAFSDGLVFPEAATGKNTHIYIDEPHAGIVTDYTGRQGYYNELSAIHLEGAPYEMTLSKLYADYLIRGLFYE